MEHSMKTHTAAYNVNRVGFYSAILTSLLTAVTFGIAIFTPPVSGSNCLKDCIEYPYLDIESRFPRDYWWMFGAIILTLVYLALMVSIHQYAAAEKKIFSQIGLVFAIVAAVLLTTDYFVQLTVIQPSIQQGETDGIALLTQYNPNGVFIALEELGYWMMSLALLCVVPVFSRRNKLERATGTLFIIGFALMVVAFVGYTVAYGIERGYRFEVAAISIDWIMLIVGGILLGRVFRQAMKTAAPSEVLHEL